MRLLTPPRRVLGNVTGRSRPNVLSSTHQHADRMKATPPANRRRYYPNIMRVHCASLASLRFVYLLLRHLEIIWAPRSRNDAPCHDFDDLRAHKSCNVGLQRGSRRPLDLISLDGGRAISMISHVEGRVAEQQKPVNHTQYVPGVQLCTIISSD